MNDSFEDKLSKQALRQVPAKWRREILSLIDEPKKDESCLRSASPSDTSLIGVRWLQALLAHPARKTIAAMWLMIVFFNVTTPKFQNNNGEPMTMQAQRPSFALLAALERQLFEWQALPDNSPTDNEPETEPPNSIIGPRGDLQSIPRQTRV